MKFKNIRKKAVAGFLTGALLVCSVGSALAADSGYDPYDNAPETTVDVNANILSGATAAANTPVLSMLGINVTCSDSVGIVGNNSSVPLNLLVFGSSLNESADPYLANYYYYYATYGYPGTYSTSTYSGWTTGAYSLVSSYAKSGPTGASNNTTTIDISVNGVTKNCNPLFFYEPDVLLGSTTSSYDTGLSYYQSEVNSSYSPLVLGGWSTGSGGYCMNDGTFASTAAMANGVYADAVAIQSYVDTLNADIEDDEDKITGRYSDIDACGATYANFAMGLYYYVQSELYASSEPMTAVKYCTALTVDDDGYTIGTGSGRMAQYADGLGTQVTSGTYATASDLAEAVDVVIASNLTDDQVKTLTTVGIKVITSLPDTVYGTTMQAPDNILGVPYYIAVFYGDTLGLTTADVTAYFVDNIYHITTSGVQTVVDTMMGTTGTTISSDYNSTINSMISTGAAYYNAGNTGGYTWDSVSTVS